MGSTPSLRPQGRSARPEPPSATPANHERGLGPERLLPGSPPGPLDARPTASFGPESSWRPSTLGGALNGGGPGPKSSCRGPGGRARGHVSAHTAILATPPWQHTLTLRLDLKLQKLDLTVNLTRLVKPGQKETLTHKITVIGQRVCSLSASSNP
ncbi:hypothetical protein NDU88_005655 [Pleurodeles waltl]|uniref:Uncharacterized protein n=1 Tax=Pleurodeles waltl TaxID=8319 RepID=A0AAV7LPP7_PLEWA|nr:hypothetical protein NDU88_005655 [Pleurodeles waltl]